MILLEEEIYGVAEFGLLMEFILYEPTL